MGDTSDHEGQDTERVDGVIAWNKDEWTGYRVWLAHSTSGGTGQLAALAAVSVAD